MCASATLTPEQAFLVLFKSCIGVAILGMPFAFRQSGIVTGVLFLILNAIVTTFTTKLLVACKRKLQESPRGKSISSVPDMALVLWGPLGLNITNIILVFCQIGNCIAYGIFLSVTSTAVIQELAIFPEHTFGIRSYDSPYFFMTIVWWVLHTRQIPTAPLFALNPPLSSVPNSFMSYHSSCHLHPAFLHPS
jgi:amino acid permease